MSPTAKAIVYAARQATMINQWGLTWEDIEANTESILQGYSIPPDGKMSPPCAVAYNALNAANSALAAAHKEVAALRDELARLTVERDEFRNAAKHRREEARTACEARDAQFKKWGEEDRKVQKLRSVLAAIQEHAKTINASHRIEKVLEETK